MAPLGTAAHVERVVRAWRQTDRAAERDEDQERQADRSLRTWVDDDGMVVVRGRLTPEVGSVFRRALEAAVAADRGAAAGGGAVAAGEAVAAGGASAISAARTEPADAVDEAAGVERSLGQRQADALGRLAECALAGGLDRGTAGDRYQVVLHVDAETLAQDAAPSAAEPAGGGVDPHGGVPAIWTGTPRPVRRTGGCPGPRAARQAALAEDGGIRVGQETARRIACDAATVTLQQGPDGGVLDVGRRTRTVSPRVAASARGARRAVPVPRLRGPALRCAPHTSLGRRRGDGAAVAGRAAGRRLGPSTSCGARGPAHTRGPRSRGTARTGASGGSRRRRRSGAARSPGSWWASQECFRASAAAAQPQRKRKRT
ncbi:MAG: DUF222 domain-containing protein [Acidobacteria bacterium]|nr:DUF222 domain-containing protein [Acidobacteriota bacterium]